MNKDGLKGFYTGDKVPKRKYRKHPVRTVRCGNCGKDFETHDPRKKYCNMYCGDLARIAKAREEKDEE